MTKANVISLDEWSILESLADGVIVLDSDWRLAYLNRKQAERFGVSASDVIGTPIWDICPEWDTPTIRQSFQQAMIHQMPVQVDYSCPKRQAWFQLRGSPSAAGLTVLVINISKQKQPTVAFVLREGDRSDVERRQEEQRKTLQYSVSQILANATTLADVVPILLQTVCEALGWHAGLFWSPAPSGSSLRCTQHWSKSPLENHAFITASQRTTFTLGVGLPGRIWNTRQAVWISNLAQDDNFPRQAAAMEAGLCSGFGFPILLGDEFFGVIECFSDRPYNPDADLLQLTTAIGRQIGQFMERKRTEAALRESEELFQNFMNHSPVAAYIKTEAGEYVYVNPVIERLFNCPASELVGKSDLDWFPLEAIAQIRANDAAVLEQNKPLQFLETVRIEGEDHHFIAFKFPLQNASGKRFLCGVSADITDRKQQEEALRSSAEQLSLALAASKMGDWHWDAATDLVTFSEQAYQIFDIQPNTVLTWTELRQRLQADDQEKARIAVEQAIRDRTDYDIEYRVINTDATQRWVAAKGRAQYDASGVVLGMLGVVQDITERKRADQEREQLLAREQAVNETLQVFIEHTPATVAMFDRHMCYLATSRRWIQEYAPTYTNLEGLSHYEVMGDVPERWRAVHQRCLAGAAERCEEDYYPRSDGSAFWLHWEVLPWYVRDGEIGGIIIFAENITERKQAEQEREQLLACEKAAREQAETANRIKDEFLAVLSHELRSPLNPILGWANLLQRGTVNEQTSRQALKTIERNAKLQAQLIDDLLDVSRILQGKMGLNTSPVVLTTVIESALETVRLAAETKRIQIQTAITLNDGRIFGDSTRLQQIVWNLLSNAVKFTPSGGRIEIRLDQVDTDAQIQVRDTGKGIAPDFLPYVFDYFRQEDGRTTRKFGGLGLGLAIVRHLTELHGGTVYAESAGEGLGASFTVRLPLMPHTLALDGDVSPPAPSLSLNHVKVLVVDDDDDARSLMQAILEQQNVQVSVAASAAEALVMVEQLQPDILISDIGMPEVDGYTLMQQLRNRSLDQGGRIPAIALTAYAGEFDQQQALRVGFQRHLAKPVDPETLIQAIADLIHPL